MLGHDSNIRVIVVKLITIVSLLRYYEHKGGNRLPLTPVDA